MLRLARLFRWIDDHTDEIMKYTALAVLVVLPYCFTTLVIKQLLQIAVFAGDAAFADTTWGALLVLVLAAIVSVMTYWKVLYWANAIISRHFAYENDDWSDPDRT